MPKDPARNIDRYKVRGGQLNEFDFQRQQGEIAQQENAQGQGPHGSDEASGLPPDQAKAERTRQLLAAHGESVPEPQQPSLLEEPQAPRPAQDIEGAKAPQEKALENLKAAKDELDRQIAAAELAKVDPLAATKQAIEQVDQIIKEQKDANAKTDKAVENPARTPDAANAQKVELDAELCSRIRASFLLAGPLLARS